MITYKVKSKPQIRPKTPKLALSDLKSAYKCRQTGQAKLKRSKTATFAVGHRDFGQNHPKMVRNGKLSLKIRILPLLDKAVKAKFGFSNRKKSEIGPFPIVREPGFWGLKLTFGPLTGHYGTFHLSWPYFDPNSVLGKTETECPITPV